MRIDSWEPIDDHVVIWGMSCVGKTTFASLLRTHSYVCFDHLYKWQEIELFGLSATGNLKQIMLEAQKKPRFVVDGWHLVDDRAKLVPPGIHVYVIYAPYDQIIAQYRVPVIRHNDHTSMFDRWYRDIAYESFPQVRYFRNCIDAFSETSALDFRKLVGTKQSV